MWCNIAGEAAGKIWNWSPFGVKGLILFKTLCNTPHLLVITTVHTVVRSVLTSFLSTLVGMRNNCSTLSTCCSFQELQHHRPVMGLGILQISLHFNQHQDLLRVSSPQVVYQMMPFLPNFRVLPHHRPNLNSRYSKCTRTIVLCVTRTYCRSSVQPLLVSTVC